MATFEHYKLVIPDDFAQLSFVHTQVGVPDEIICTLGVREQTGDLEQSDLDDVRDAWVANIVPMLSDLMTFEKVVARDAGGVFLESFDGTAGASSSQFLPVSNAVIVEKRTGVSGRRNRGRMYLPVAGDASTDSAGVVDGTALAGIQTNMDGLQTDIETAMGAAPGGMYILHSKGWDGAVEPADPGNAPAPTLITSFVAKSLIGTQRRRIR